MPLTEESIIEQIRETFDPYNATKTFKEAAHLIYQQHLEDMQKARSEAWDVASKSTYRNTFVIHCEHNASIETNPKGIEADKTQYLNQFSK